MRSIFIAIPDEAAERLRELARREFRAPRQQAAVLVLAGLERAGLSPDLTSETGAEPRVLRARRARPSSGAATPASILDGAG